MNEHQLRAAKIKLAAWMAFAIVCAAIFVRSAP
jgi:hypothetical protein